MVHLTHEQRKHLLQDMVFITLSIAFAVWLGKSAALDVFMNTTRSVKFLGSFIAGTFFTSAFTTAPAITVLGKIAQSNPIFPTAFFGGIGALCGDFIIFKFVSDRLSNDLKTLVSKPAEERFEHIVNTRLFRWFSPFLAALVIASPLPDELGVAIIGVLHPRTLLFIPFSFLANFAGILAISGIAKVIA